MANEQTKTKLPLTAVGLYICAGIMAVLFVLSIVGIAIGSQARSPVRTKAWS